jgi:hypothetical protein
MIDIASLITLCKTVGDALKTGKGVVEALQKKKLSDQERELLLAAAKKGEFFLTSVDQIPGTWIRVDGRDFVEAGDPAVAARYMEAFRSLCERGYVRHEGGHLFMLTGSGFDKARSLDA